MNPNNSRGAKSPPTMPEFPAPPPGFLSDPSGGNYHPDFMFCGACTTCQEPSDKEELEEEEKLETYLDGDNDDYGDGDSNDDDEYFRRAQTDTLKSKFYFQEKITNPSHTLVIQSLLQPLPGVTKVVVHANEPSIEVDHDASMSTEVVLHSLESAGHPAVLHSTQGESSGGTVPIWVRSQFFVRGICCATEVPIVKRIIKATPGVSKVQINLTTKLVNVEHDIACLSAQQIGQKLSQEGFSSRIQRDGQVTASTKQQAQHHGTTILQIHKMLTEEDTPQIESTLHSVNGVHRINVDLSESTVHVEHDVHRVSSSQCMNLLSQQGYQVTVQVAAEGDVENAAAAALDQIGQSNYVESTVALQGLLPQQVRKLEIVMEENFSRGQVRAIYPNVISETVKVEHDPHQASIVDICDALSSQGLDAKVSVDGSEVGLYLPLESNHENNHIPYSGADQSLLQVHANVWLSGIFWVLSIVSYGDGLEWFKYFGLASVAFGLPPICAKAWRTVRRSQFDANCMMVTAAVGALMLGEYDEAASVAFLFAVSEYLEARATLKARRAMSAIVSLRPDHANVIHPITKEIVVVPADKVPLGSTISIRTGDKIATDGIVVEGSSSVDESSLTGESRPVHKKAGDEVSGGTINIGSTQLLVRTTTTVDDSAVSRLVRLVEEAQSNRSPTEKMIDTFARSYTPSVMLLASLMCTIPWYWGSEIGRYWTLNGLIIIVVACPCALTISTPVTYAAALAATAQRGIVVKGGAKLEAMGSVDRVVFDKTGTLTKGKFSVLHLEAVGKTKSREEMLKLLAIMQERSSHPVSASLVQAAKDEGIQIPRHISINEHTILKGEGITAKADGRQIYVGNKRLFTRLGLFSSLPVVHKNLVKSWSSTGGTVGFIGSADDGIIGMFCVVDAVRDEARAVIDGLKDANIDTMICTGDSDAAAQAVAKTLGIPRGAVHSQLLPEDKLHFVGSLKRPQPKTFALCRQKRYVLFCGDGVNDAPALAVADIGMSMGEGAAMAMEMSDVTLMDSQLTKLSYTIKMGRRVLRTVKENILISLLAKVLVVGLAFLGKMTLLLAIAADVGIMLLVTLNGMKLLPTHTHGPMEMLKVTNLQRHRRRRTGVGSGDFEMTLQMDPDEQNAYDDGDDEKAEIV